MNLKPLRGPALAASLLLVVAACGGTEDASAGSSDPITVMSWTSLANPAFATPQTKVAAEAAVNRINDEGGVNGREIELIYCDSNFDPNTEAGCARQAIDEEAVAVVGAVTFFPNTLPLLERAGIANIGSRAASMSDLQSEISFPLGPGSAGLGYGDVALALQEGLERVSIVTSNNPTSASQTEYMQDALEEAGIELVEVVTAPSNAPDQSAAAASAAEGTDGVIMSAAPNDAVKVFRSLYQSGYEGKRIAHIATLNDENIEALGDAADGIYTVGQTMPTHDPSNETVETYLADMEEADPSADTGESALGAYVPFMLFAQVAETLDTIDATSVLEAMENLDEPVELGAVAPYSVKGKESPLEDSPRIFNPTVVLGQINDGKVSALDDTFTDPFAVVRGN